MFLKNVVAILVASCSLALPGAVEATLPPDQEVEVNIRKTPSNPSSPIIWTITLQIHALAQVGNDYKWEISGVELRKLGEAPEYDEVWYESLPMVDTSDGYWWVAYVGNESNFRQLPPIAGLAVNGDPNGDDLNYDFVGEAPGMGPEDGYLTFVLQQEGAEDPYEEGDDEPTEVPEGVRDPMEAAQ